MDVRAERFGLVGVLRAVGPLELQGLVQPRFAELDAGVRVDNSGVLDVVPQRRPGSQWPPSPFDSRPVGRSDVDVSSTLLGFVSVRVDDEFEVLRLVLPLRPGGNFGGLARRELRVENRRGDTDTLLTAGLFARVEPGAVEELPEHLGNLLFRDSGTVVLDDERVVVSGFTNFDGDVGLDSRLLGCVEGVVYRLLYGGDQASCPRVEPEHVLVLLEELGDGNRALALGQLLCDSRILAERRLERGHSVRKVFGRALTVLATGVK